MPTIIVSPFAKRHFVDHTTYDTTSILKLIETRWGLTPLGDRDADAADMAFGGSMFCGLNVLRKGTEEQKRHWLPKLLERRDQDDDLDVGAGRGLRHRRDAHDGAPRRRQIGHQRAEDLGPTGAAPRTTSSTSM